MEFDISKQLTMGTKAILNPVSGNFQLNDCMLFCFVTDEVTDENQKIIFKYQLFCKEDDKPASKVKTYEPKEVGEFYVYGFDNQHRRFLSTKMIKSFDDKTDVVDNFKKEFYLKYWEEVIQLNKCDKNGAVRETRGELDTPPYTVQNSVSQTYQNIKQGFSNLPTGKPVLHNKPKCIHICKNGKDLVYLCSDDVVQIKQSPIGEDGTIYPGITTSRSNGVVCVGVDTWQTTYDILIGQGVCLKGFNVSYEINGVKVHPDTYYHFKCCCKDGLNIYYKESGGGFSGLFFCQLDGTNFSSSEVIGCTYNEVGFAGFEKDIQDIRRMNAGNRILRKEGAERLFGTIRVPDDKSVRRWLNDFRMSNEYFYLDCDDLGNEYFVKFKIDPGDIQTSIKDGDLQISMSGVIEQPYYQNC